MRRVKLYADALTRRPQTQAREYATLVERVDEERAAVRAQAQENTTLQARLGRERATMRATTTRYDAERREAQEKFRGYEARLAASLARVAASEAKLTDCKKQLDVSRIDLAKANERTTAADEQGRVERDAAVARHAALEAVGKSRMALACP